MRRPGPIGFLWAGGMLLLAVVLLLSAWLCDDAYITFRTVDNFCNGHGLRWNIIERVQSYTHPLWMFCLAGARCLTGEIYYTSLILSMLISLAAVSLMTLKVARTPVAGLLALLALLFSRSFMDYSTSGLENPLTHLLLALFLWEYLRPRTRFSLLRLTLIASLCFLNRLDLILLLGPALAWRFWSPQFRWRRLLAVFLGLTPLLAWEVFSVIYYGFPVANTAYAKLQSGIAAGDYLQRGFIYLGVCAKQDPLSAMIVLGGLVMPAVRRWRDGIAISLGLVLYLIYVLRIGGDFMLGRFLAAPLFLSVGLLAAMDWKSSRRNLWLTVIVVVGLGFLNPRPTVLTGRRYGVGTKHIVHASGIGDERDFYYPATGLLRDSRGEDNVEHLWADLGRQLAKTRAQPVEGGSVGFMGYLAGPRWYIVDVFGLTDPLLARLPAIEQADWRVGHHRRQVPDGYLASSQGVVKMADPQLASYYRDLRLVTRGKLWRRERWAAIWRVNTGSAPSN